MVSPYSENYNQNAGFLFEGLKMGAVNFIVRAAQGKNGFKVPIGIGIHSMLYEKIVEPRESMFGFQFPKLETFFGGQEDDQVDEIMLMAQKIIYLCLQKTLQHAVVGSLGYSASPFEIAATTFVRGAVGWMIDEKDIPSGTKARSDDYKTAVQAVINKDLSGANTVKLARKAGKDLGVDVNSAVYEADAPEWLRERYYNRMSQLYKDLKEPTT